MNIEGLKMHLCELVEEAYETAIEEGHHEIIQPFRVVIHEDGTVDYVPLRGRVKQSVSTE